MRESTVSSHVRLYAAQAGCQLWRNNSGACVDQTGRTVRYGLCNESAKMNKRVKSSDLIGFTPVVITPDMVGKVVAVFTAVETKPQGWKLQPSDKRGIAQKAFHDIITPSGGFAGFAESVESFRKITGK